VLVRPDESSRRVGLSALGYGACGAGTVFQREPRRRVGTLAVLSDQAQAAGSAGAHASVRREDSRRPRAAVGQPPRLVRQRSGGSDVGERRCVRARDDNSRSRRRPLDRDPAETVSLTASRYAVSLPSDRGSRGDRSAKASAARRALIAAKTNIKGWTVTVYRMLISTGASVSGTYAISSSGRPIAAPPRMPATTPHPHTMRNTIETAVAAA